MADSKNRVLTIGAVLGLCAAALASPDPPKKVAAAVKPAAAAAASAPVQSAPASMGLAPVPRPFGSSSDRAFGGTHIGRPFAPIGSNRPLAPIGTDRPLAPIGGGGPGASIQPPVSVPGTGGPGGIGSGGGRTIVVVPELPQSEPGLEIAEPLPQVPDFYFEQPAQQPAVMPLELVTPAIDPVIAEMAARLRADGHAQFLRGEFHLAEPTLRSAVDLMPDATESNSARVELAFSLLALGRINSAAKEFVLAESKDPDLFKSMLDAASVVGSKTFDRCALESAKYVAAYPIESDALFVDALMQWWSGRLREAGLELERLVAIDPKYAGLKADFVPRARDEALKPQ